MSELEGVHSEVTADPAEAPAKEVPAGYTAHGGPERCDECIFYSGRTGDPDAPGDCLVHGPPPYQVEAGGWCPAWEPNDGSLPDFSFD